MTSAQRRLVAAGDPGVTHRGCAPARTRTPHLARCRAVLSRLSRGATLVAALDPPRARQRPAFKPTGVTAAPADTQAGANSNFTLHFDVEEPSRDLKGFVIHLPPGEVGAVTATPAVHAGPVRGEGVPGQHAGRHDRHARDRLPHPDHGPRRRRPRQALQPRARRPGARAAGHPPDPRRGRRDPAAVDRHRAPGRRRAGLEHRRPAADLGPRPHRHQRRRHHAVRQGGRSGQGLRLQPDLVRGRPPRRSTPPPTTAPRDRARPSFTPTGCDKLAFAPTLSADRRPRRQGRAAHASRRSSSRPPGQANARSVQITLPAGLGAVVTTLNHACPRGRVRPGRVRGQRPDRQRQGRDARARRPARGPGRPGQARRVAAARAHHRPARPDRPEAPGDRRLRGGRAPAVDARRPARHRAEPLHAHPGRRPRRPALQRTRPVHRPDRARRRDLRRARTARARARR